VRVNERNAAVLRDYLQTTVIAGANRAESGGDLEAAFDAAFETLAFNDFNSAKPDCLPAIVWVTGAEPDNALRLHINKLNEGVNAQIHVFSTRAAIDEFAHRIACDNTGSYVSAPSAADMEAALPRYYVGQAVARREDQIATASGGSAGRGTPVMGFTSLGFRPVEIGRPELGLIMTLAQPAYSGRALIGLLGLEFELQDLASVFARHQSASTIFLMGNNQADALVHPLLAEPRDVNTEDFLDTRHVEVTPAFFNVRSGMIARSSGTRAPIAAIRPQPERYTDVVLSSFDWTFVEGTPFSVCLARPITERHVVLLEQVPAGSATSADACFSTFLEQYPPSVLDAAGVAIVEDVAAHGTQPVTYSTALFAQPPSGWRDSSAYARRAESNDTVLALHAYVNNAEGAINPGVLTSIKSHARIVAASSAIGKWRSSHAAHMLYRSVTFFDGLSYVYPGPVGLDKAASDARLSAWFGRALSYSATAANAEAEPAEQVPQTVALSTPWIGPDADAGVTVTTLSIALPDTAVAQDVAVMRYDIDHRHLHEQLVGAMPGCRLQMADSGAICALIDGRGYLVSHPHIYDHSQRLGQQVSVVVDQFVGVKHPELTRALFDADVLVETKQVDTVARANVIELFVDPIRLIKLGGHFESSSADGCETTSSFSLQPVANTNLYLLHIGADYVGLGSRTCAAFRPPPPTPYVIDACEEVQFDYRSPVTTENCPNDIVFTDARLDQARADYAQCEGLGKYREIDWVRYSDTIAIAITTLTAIIMFVTFLCFVVIFMHRDDPIIRASSPVFLLIMLIGALISFATIFFLAGEPDGNICRSRAWFICIGFALMFSCLLSKTWRIASIFSTSSLRVRPISNMELLKYVSVPLALNAFVLLLWSTIDSPDADTITDQTDDDKLFLQCQSDDQWVWQGVLIGINATLVVIGIYLCFRVRKVPSSFNESKWISFSIYSVSVCGLIGIALGSALEEFPAAWYAVLSASILLGVSSIVVFIFFQKLFIVYFQPEKNTSEYTSGSLARPSTTHGTSQLGGLSSSSN
jgi:7 transmembrane sweet-taste receptor of 3 GCPR